MRPSRLVACNATAALFLAALLCVPMWGANPAQPGSINYVEGQVAIGNRNLDRTSVGSVNLDAGQSITTGNGKVEILLTPGVFLRVDGQSSATMVSPGLADTEVRLVKGRAMVEVDEIHKETWRTRRFSRNAGTTEILSRPSSWIRSIALTEMTASRRVSQLPAWLIHPSGRRQARTMNLFGAGPT